MNRIIRKAISSEVADIMHVIEDAKGIMRSSGNMHQWVDGYPSGSVILSDIEHEVGYVVVDGTRIVGYFAFIPSPDPTYAKIYQGEWTDDSLPYHVIHRIASYPDVHNIFRDIIDFCYAIDTNLRVDTHRDNTIMQHNLLKHGFTYCGIIYLLSGDERLAYQKVSL